jgi:hypothetical protein
MEKTLKTLARAVAISSPPEDWSSFGEIGRDIEVATGQIPNASSAQSVLCGKLHSAYPAAFVLIEQLFSPGSRQSHSAHRITLEDLRAFFWRKRHSGLLRHLRLF